MSPTGNLHLVVVDGVVLPEQPQLILPQIKMCKRCGEIFPATLEYFGTKPKTKGGLNQQCRECSSYYSHNCWKQRRERGLIEYANGDIPCCARCGTTVYEFLTYEHINGGGDRERREKGRRDNYHITQEVQRGERRKDVGILCMNCNHLARLESLKGTQSTSPHAVVQRRVAKKLHIEVLTGLCGGLPYCACCGITDIRLLSVEHLEGGGRKHLTQCGGNHAVYRAIRREGYPRDKYAVLCHNCNHAWGYYDICPHELERIAEEVA